MNKTDDDKIYERLKEAVGTCPGTENVHDFYLKEFELINKMTIEEYKNLPHYTLICSGCGANKIVQNKKD